MIRRLRKWWLRRSETSQCASETYLETEIRRVQKARDRHQRHLDDIGYAWHEAGGICCPGCFSHGEWSRLADKIDRIDTLLPLLRAKQQTKEKQ